MNTPSLPSSSSSSLVRRRESILERPAFIDPFASTRRTHEAFYAIRETASAIIVSPPPTPLEAAALCRIRSSSSSSGYSPSAESVATQPAHDPRQHPRPSSGRRLSTPQAPPLPGPSRSRFASYHPMSAGSVGAEPPPHAANPTLPPPFRALVTGPPGAVPLFTRQPFTAGPEEFVAGVVPGQMVAEGSRGTYPEVSKGRKGRTPTACRPCNQNKIGCNRTMPCDNCVKKGIQDQCKYPTQHASWATQARDRAPKRKRETPRRPEPLLPLPAPRRSPNLPSITSPDSDTPTSREFRHPPSDPISPFTSRVPLWASEPSYPFSRLLIDAPPHLPPSSSASTSSAVRIAHPAPAPPLMLWRQREESHERTHARPTDVRRSSEPTASRRQRESLAMVHADDRETLMEDSQPPVIGTTRPISGMPQYVSASLMEGFLGSSHFGPESAQKFLSGNLSVPMYGVDSRPINTPSQLDETKPYSLVSQVRELLAIVPPREVCDRYVKRFFDKWNSHVDFLYRPDFDATYGTFWGAVGSPDTTTIDLRHMALVLVVLAFGVLLDHDPRHSSQLDLFRQYVDSPEKQREVDGLLQAMRESSLSLEEREGLSLKWSWGARRALTEAGSFYGDSLITVKATGLLALYLISCRRVTEGWKMTAQAINAAQAQGMHQDGSKWNGMSLREAEIRRRMWAQLYTLDRSVSLYLGRPVAIVDGRFTTLEPSNLSDLDLHELPERHTSPVLGPSLPAHLPLPLEQPTKSTFLILHFRLAQIIGQVQDKCFGLHDRDFADVVRCEKLFQDYRDSLPAHWRLDRPDVSLDNVPGYEYLKFQRLSLISKFHLARVTLHRPYITHNHPETSESRKACLQSSVADLTLRTSLQLNDPLDRFKWLTVASGFNSATVIGVMCIWALRHRFRSDEVRYKQEYLLGLLERYIEIESSTVRRDEKLYKEIDVLQYMVAYVKNPEIRARSQSRDPWRGRGGSVGAMSRRAPSPPRGAMMSMPPMPIIPASQKPSLGALLHSSNAGVSLLTDSTLRPPTIPHLTGEITLATALPLSPTLGSMDEPSSRAESWSSTVTGPATAMLYQPPSHTDPTASVLPLAPEMGMWENTIQNIDDEGSGFDFDGLADLSIEVLLGLSGLMYEGGAESQDLGGSGREMRIFATSSQGQT